MEQKAAYLEKLEKELAKIELKPIQENLETETLEKEIETSLVLSRNLDYVKTRESATGNPDLTCTIIEGAEGFGDVVLVSKTAGQSPAEVTELELAISSSIDTLPKYPRIEDRGRGSNEANGSPPAKVPKTVRTGFDSEESAIAQEAGKNAKEISSTAEEDKVDEDLNSQEEYSESENESEDESVPDLSPEDMKELEMMSETTKLHSKLIEARVEELHSKLKREAEDHCLSVKQKAIDEIMIFKRPSSVVVEEYHRTILTVMKYYELQLEEVTSYQKSAHTCAIDDFKNNERGVLDKVRERQQLSLEKKDSRKRSIYYIHNPFVFYLTFVIILTLYTRLIAHLLHLSSIGEL